MGNSAHIAPEIHLAWHQLRFQDVVFDFSKQPTFELGILGYAMALMLACTNAPPPVAVVGVPSVREVLMQWLPGL